MTWWSDGKLTQRWWADSTTSWCPSFKELSRIPLAYLIRNARSSMVIYNRSAVGRSWTNVYLTRHTTRQKSSITWCTLLIGGKSPTWNTCRFFHFRPTKFTVAETAGLGSGELCNWDHRIICQVLKYSTFPPHLHCFKRQPFYEFVWRNG